MCVQATDELENMNGDAILEHTGCGGAGEKACDVNHAVTVVGYGTDNGVDYWKIANT